MSLTERLGHARTQFRELGAAGAINYKLARLWGRIFRHRAPYALRSRWAEAPVWVRPESSDLAVFGQIFLEREYRGLDDVTEAGFIIDCGANVGYSAVYLLSRFPKARLVAIEPERSNFEALRRNTAAFGDRITCLQAGVWSHPAGLVVEEHDTKQGKEWAFTVREANATELPHVMATELTSVWRNAGSPVISVLKMDIEGSERVVFDAPEKPWLGAVENIVIELHGADCSAALHRAIDGLGFAISTCGELTVCKRKIPSAPALAARG